LGELVESIKAIGSNSTNPSDRDYEIKATTTIPQTAEESAGSKMDVEAKRHSYVHVYFALFNLRFHTLTSNSDYALRRYRRDVWRYDHAFNRHGKDSSAS
jgi:hypothetical protein